MIPARKAIDEHAQDVVNDELLVHILPAFVQCTRSLRTTRNAWLFQSVRSLEHSNAPTNNIPIVLVIATSPLHHAKQVYSRGDNLVVWRQYMMYNGSIVSEWWIIRNGWKRQCPIRGTTLAFTWRDWYEGVLIESLARLGRKQAAATKIGIYSTNSPRSSIRILARCSNFCKPLKKKSEGCPSNQVSAAAMTSPSDEKWRPFNCFFFNPGNMW